MWIAEATLGTPRAEIILAKMAALPDVSSATLDGADSPDVLNTSPISSDQGNRP